MASDAGIEVSISIGVVAGLVIFCGFLLLFEHRHRRLPHILKNPESLTMKIEEILPLVSRAASHVGHSSQTNGNARFGANKKPVTAKYFECTKHLSLLAKHYNDYRKFYSQQAINSAHCYIIGATNAHGPIADIFNGCCVQLFNCKTDQAVL
ncbi:hypothetical protein BX667DRAFT_524943 [Coemansia mojavensis]|nr:hypothetical protein BX667DRAFT_524943 [Coemansia mojavensis]